MSNSNSNGMDATLSGYNVPSASSSYSKEEASAAIDGLLATGGASTASTNEPSATAEPDVGSESLPFPAPLSHSIFLIEPFSPSSFLLTRKHMSLDDLRSELRSYLAVLRADLVAIINSDYEDFVSLGGARLLGPSSSSSSGRGGAEEDNTLGLRMRGPLERCGMEVKDAKEELGVIQSKLRKAMHRREAIRERKAQCRKLLGVNEQIGKVEEMLLIQQQQPEQPRTEAEGGKQDGKALSVQTGSTAVNRAQSAGLRKVSPAHKKLDRSMGSDTKRLERVAHEYSQLLYLTRKSEGLRFVETLQPRIDRISSTLQQDLSSLLSSTIASLHALPSISLVSGVPSKSISSNSKASVQTEQKARLESLSDLFRTYSSLRLYREAESVIRKQVVVDFLVRTIHREALLAPQSPMMPVTPFSGFGSLGSVFSAAANAATASPSTMAMSSPASTHPAAGFPFNMPASPASGLASPGPFERQQQSQPIAPTSSIIVQPDDKAAIPRFYLIDPISPPSTTSSNTGGGTYISDALVDLYNKLLVFLSKELGAILEVAERRPALGSSSSSSGESAPTAGRPDSPATSRERHHPPTAAAAGQSMANSVIIATAGKPGFEILANVFWHEVATRLMAECGHLIFSAGRPEAFHRNYLATLAFIERIENLCPTMKYLQILRNHPSYQAFMKRWQLPVYFQLRFKEIIGSLESSLSAHGISQAPAAVQSTQLLMAASEAAHKAISTCWADEIFLPDLAGRFWRLTLQIISRYKTWLDGNLPDYTATAVQQQQGGAQSGLNAPGAMQRSASGVNLQRLLPTALSASNASSRANTPQPGAAGSSSATMSEEQSDEDSLRKLSLAVADILRFEQMLKQLFESAISPKLGRLNTESADADADTPEAILAASLGALTAIVPALLAQLIVILSKRCAEPLRLVRSGASQVRANASSKSNKPLEPSYFVPNILRPAKLFLDSSGSGSGRHLPSSEKSALVQGLFEDLSTRYEAALAKMKDQGEALRKLKRGRQGTGFSLFGRNSGTATTGNDTGPTAEDEKVKEQMSADVEAFARDAESLGVQLDKSEALKSLRAIVEDWNK